METVPFEKLTRGEIITALIHYYRAEVTRSIAWRERLDLTTNWAVGSAAAFLGFSFSHPEIHHSLFLFGLVIVYTLLFVEARRYRFFDAYEYRVRLLHRYFIHDVLTGRLNMEEGSHWVAELASDLRYPQYKMDFIYALGQRFKANYIYLFAVLLAGWLLKIKLHPVTARTWNQYLDQAAMGDLSGWFTLIFILVFIGHGAVLLYIVRKPLGGGDIFYTVPPQKDQAR
jgi:uncharacterized membrane protein